MSGLIDQNGTTGLTYIPGKGLQWQTAIGGPTLIIATVTPPPKG